MKCSLHVQRTYNTSHSNMGSGTGFNNSRVTFDSHAVQTNLSVRATKLGQTTSPKQTKTPVKDSGNDQSVCPI